MFACPALKNTHKKRRFHKKNSGLRSRKKVKVQIGIIMASKKLNFSRDGWTIQYLKMKFRSSVGVTEPGFFRSRNILIGKEK